MFYLRMRLDYTMEYVHIIILNQLWLVICTYEIKFMSIIYIVWTFRLTGNVISHLT